MSKRTYIVEEVVHYEVEADTAQEAIDSIVNNADRDKFFLSCCDRTIWDGPAGYEDEEYTS